MSAELELQLELARVKAALDRSKEDADRLRGLWPRAELQRVHLALAAQEAELAVLRREHGALVASTVGRVPAPVFRVLEALRPVARAVRLGMRLVRVARALPSRLALRRQRRADAAVLRASPLFDGAWYRAHAMAGDAQSDPVAHYLWLGCAVGHDPHPLFDSAWYAARHPGLGNPFADYVRRGMAADEDPHPLFDVAYYVAQAPDAAGRALVHHGARAAGDTRSPAALFDPAAYAADHPEAAADPLAHYAREGSALDPHPLFDAAWYRAAYCGAGVNPLAHWMREGAARGLPPNGWGVRPGRWRVPGDVPEVSVVVLPSAKAMATARSVLCAGAVEGVEVILAATAGPALPGLRLLAAEAGANPCAWANAAARLARGPVLAVVPPGSVAQHGWLPPMLAILREHAAAGLVAAGSDGHARRVAVAGGSALVMQTAAFWAAGGFDEGFGGFAAASAALAQALRASGQEMWVQPASRVSAPVEAMGAADRERFEARWAAVASAALAARRTVLVLDGAPEAGEALEALLRQGLEAVLSTAAPAAGWEARGARMLVGEAALQDWLASDGGEVDEVWSFRRAQDVPAALLLRWTGAALRQWGLEGEMPAWCDGVLTAQDFHAG